MGSAPSPHAVNNAASGVQNTVRSITQIIQQQTTAQQNPSSDGEGAVWIMRFNRDGRFLAAGGQDAILRVWTLVSEPDAPAAAAATLSEANGNESDASPNPSATNRKLPFIFKKHPYRLYRGHKSDILDLSWSKVSVTSMVIKIERTRLEWFLALLFHGQNCSALAHFSERMPLLFSALRFCHLHRISSKRRPILFIRLSGLSSKVVEYPGEKGPILERNARICSYHSCWVHLRRQNGSGWFLFGKLCLFWNQWTKV